MTAGSETTLNTNQHHGSPRPDSHGTAAEKPLTQNAEPPTQIEPVYPTTASFWTIFIGLFLAAFCVGLVRIPLPSSLPTFLLQLTPNPQDRSIIATAIPQITSDFNSLADVGWYGSGYLLTTCCFQLLFGKLYAEFSIKWVFLGGLAVFEIGSIICAVAPGSVVLIVGRAVAGVGGAGIVSGALIVSDGDWEKVCLDVC